MSGSKEGFERWNTHQTLLIEQEVFGTTLRLAQDPNSSNLGTTVWDSSIVLAKYLEKNVRKGEFSRVKAKGKRAVELGSGMGLGGMALAMVGADVVLTDMAEVLPLLRRNVDCNLSAATVHGHWGSWVSSLGKVSVRELDWAQPEHAAALLPPVDYILAADCVYHEHVIEHLLRTVMDLTTERSTILICNEFRSHSVHSRFMELFTPYFVIKKVPHSKMDAVYQHPQIELYMLKKRRKPLSAAAMEAGEAADADGGEDEADEAAAPESKGSLEPLPTDAAAAAAAPAASAAVPSAAEEAGGAASVPSPASASAAAPASDGPEALAASTSAEANTPGGSADCSSDGSPSASTSALQAASAGGADLPASPRPPLTAGGGVATSLPVTDDALHITPQTWSDRRAGAEVAKLMAGLKVPTK